MPEEEANTNLFDELFVDFVKSKFFNHPDRGYSGDDILSFMPNFYHHKDMTSAAMDILLMKNDIIQLPLIGNVDKYKANPEAIKELKIEGILQKNILSLTQQNLILQNKDFKTKRKWAIIGALGGSILTFIITYAKEIKTVAIHLFQ